MPRCNNMADHTDKPLYCFVLNQDGTITANTYTRYQTAVIPQHNRDITKLTVKTPSGLVIKTIEDQFDRCLQGRVYTFDPDIDRARQMILDKYKEQAATLSDQLERTKILIANMESHTV